MKVGVKIICTIWFLVESIGVNVIFAQATSYDYSIECSVPEITSRYSSIEQPIYPGGIETLVKEIEEKTIYPDCALEYKVSGKVSISFQVNDEGKPEKFKTVYAQNNCLGEAATSGAKAAVKTFTRPALHEGRPSTSTFSLSVTFKIQGMPIGSCIHSEAYHFAMEGMKEMDEGNYTKAISYFSESIEIDSSYYEGYLDRAKAFRKTGQTTSAIKDVKSSLNRANPEREEALSLLGSLYIELGENEKALECLTQALSIDAKHYLSLVECGKIYLLRSDTEKAESYLRKALKQHHTPTDAWYYLGLIELTRSEFKSGVKLFSKVIKSRPDYAKAYHNRGMCYARMRDMDSACVDWRKAKEFGVTEVELLVKSQCKNQISK